MDNFFQDKPVKKMPLNEKIFNGETNITKKSISFTQDAITFNCVVITNEKKEIRIDAFAKINEQTFGFSGTITTLKTIAKAPNDALKEIAEIAECLNNTNIQKTLYYFSNDIPSSASKLTTCFRNLRKGLKKDEFLSQKQEIFNDPSCILFEIQHMDPLYFFLTAVELKPENKDKIEEIERGIFKSNKNMLTESFKNIDKIEDWIKSHSQ